MESTRRFKPPWTLIRENSECYVVRDASGVTVAWLFCRDDTQRYSVGASKLTSEEARRIGKAISRIPEFMMPHQGFYPRGGGPRWRADRWTPSCFGIASRGAGYAAREFHYPERPADLPSLKPFWSKFNPRDTR